MQYKVVVLSSLYVYNLLLKKTNDYSRNENVKYDPFKVSTK